MSPADALLDQLAELLAERVAEKMAKRLEPSARVNAANAEEHGAHWSWIVARSREGKITLRGARGRRYVLASELAQLLDASTLKAAPRRESPVADALEDTRAIVADLARKRA